MAEHSWIWVIMEHSAKILDQFNVPYQARALSAHRTPQALVSYLSEAEQQGVEVWIAAAGGAAHLPGVIAAHTTRPVLGVPIPSSTFVNGLDALLAIVQMPGGIPVGTLAVGKPGAVNAALLAVSILANKYPEYADRLKTFRQTQSQQVLDNAILKG